MESYVKPWVDGEKIPDDRIIDIYCHPPEVPAIFHRSSMIIGSRGAGKTTLFRYQKAIHNGIALHISLATEFASLTKQTGFGPQAFDIPTHLEPLISGKATSLLALSIAERMLNKGITVPFELLNNCLPETIRIPSSPLETDWVNKAKHKAASAPIELFKEIDDAGPLPTLICSFGEASQKIKGPLLLLLDRADNVPSPSLVPVIELMDQSSLYITLVAMRPGHAGRSLANICNTVVPGDHYAVVHLGTHPSSPKWEEFVEAAVQAQFGERLTKIPCTTKKFIYAIARDSIRVALDICNGYLSPPNDPRSGNIIASLEDLRENLITAAQRTLQQYHPDFRRWINELRKEIQQNRGSVFGPLLLFLEPRPKRDLFDKPAELNRFIEVGLRNSALCMPEGQRWVPGLRITQVEIPPILVWEKDDKFWTRESAQQIVLNKQESEIMKTHGPLSNYRPSIFIAYRMDFPESKKFRQDFQQRLNVHPEFSRWEVTDGKTPAGVYWAKTIRKRIKNARIVVADVTGMRHDVLFELGFAYGLGKVTIPCVSEPNQRKNLPRWIGVTQIGTFDNHKGLTGILSSINDHLSNPEFSKPAQAKKAVPSLTVFFKSCDWSRNIAVQFSEAAKREGLKDVVIDEGFRDEDALERSASASLFVAILDGSPSDALVHYVCGAIASKPTAGYGQTLKREILLIEKPGNRKMSLVADSLRNSEITQLIMEDQLPGLLASFGEKHRKWAETPIPPRKRR